MSDEQLINHLIAKTDKHEREIEALKLLLEELQMKVHGLAERVPSAP